MRNPKGLKQAKSNKKQEAIRLDGSDRNSQREVNRGTTKQKEHNIKGEEEDEQVDYLEGIEMDDFVVQKKQRRVVQKKKIGGGGKKNR